MSRPGGSDDLLVRARSVERKDNNPSRLVDKDAYDAYRVLVAIPTPVLTEAFSRLLVDSLAGGATATALDYLAVLFGTPRGTGSVMAGRSEELVGDPEVVAAACAALAGDLLAALGRRSVEGSAI